MTGRKADRISTYKFVKTFREVRGIFPLMQANFLRCSAGKTQKNV